MAKQSNDAPVEKRKDLSKHSKLMTYKTLMYGDNGNVYVQTFYCIPGDSVMINKQEIVPVVYLTQPNADGEQYATVDANGKPKATARDTEWVERVTSNEVALNEVLDGYVATLQKEAI